MKRILTIIAIILLVIAAIVGTLFFIARKRAVNNNVVPPTFKQFLGIGTTTSPTTNPPVGTDSSEFTDPADTTPPVPTPTTQNIPTGTSVFTSGGFTPTGSTPPDVIVGGGGTGTGTGTGSTGTTDPTDTGGTGGGVIVTAAPSCSDEDTTITFTPEEITKLNALKNRFFAIAETLHTDADVSLEATNYDAFKTREIKIAEMYNFCINSPVYTGAQATVVAAQPYGTVVPGTNGPINYRVPTPFWHDLTKDNQAFVHQGSNWKGIFHYTDETFAERAIEHALRLNLW